VDHGVGIVDAHATRTRVLLHDGDRRVQ
jgi:hypothetical protein